MTPRLLVVQTAFLGDVVLTTPLLRALRRRCPNAHLVALVTPAAAPLVEEDPHLDELWTYDKRGGDGLPSMVARVRTGRFDIVVTPHRSPRTALLSLLSWAPRRVGFGDGALSWVHTHPVARPGALHEADRNLALLRGLGSEPEPADRVLHVGYTDRERTEVEAAVALAGLDPVRPLVVLFPGSVWATKRWSEEGFARVGRALADRGFSVAVLGGPGDRDVAARVVAGGGPGVVDLAGRTSLKALAAWMDRAVLAVTNDSAPLHVAAARRTPTVAVFGATTPDLGFGPFHHPASRVVGVDLSCRPCGLHGGRRCPRGHFRCMGEIAPETVLGACDELLEPGS